MVSLTTGDANGQIKYSKNGTSFTNVNVKGLGSAAYTNSNVYQPAGSYAAANHNHDDRYYTKTQTNNIACRLHEVEFQCGYESDGTFRNDFSAWYNSIPAGPNGYKSSPMAVPTSEDNRCRMFLAGTTLIFRNMSGMVSEPSRVMTARVWVFTC